MNEAFIQYIWKMKLFNSSLLQTTEGENILIINSGTHNFHSGPDFTNARIKIGETTWAGNVEIHIKTSDWKNHHHPGDRAYDNVILHVVYEHDDEENKLPTLILKGLIDDQLVSVYNFMMQTSAWIPCEKNIRNIPEIIIKEQLTRLLTERIEKKALNFEQRLYLNKNDWEETCFQLIARNLGTNINAEPFERVARSLPFKTILKHINNPMQVEALLFGQAGFLEGGFREVYPHQLQAEYKFLQKKYELEGIRLLEWKFLRMRPANFPTMRMSQLADFVAKNDKIFSRILELKDVKKIKTLFKVKAADYWKEHYHFKKAAPAKSALMGNDMIDLILINTISPLLFLYGRINGDDQFITRATDILENIEAENNNIIRNWIDLGITPKHAGESQGLLELKNNYCTNKRCLECAMGHRILKCEKNV
ncbi:MAG: DUF2851 family protein [Chitinophagales bacterium]